MLVSVTGLPSVGKSRLVTALARELAGAHVTVTSSGSAVRCQIDAGEPIVRVHAESDVDALMEGEMPLSYAADDADLVVRVDWEPPDRSVRRVVELLAARGRARSAVGA
jgi:hypothetical protein